jgi:hypothetical protein
MSNKYNKIYYLLELISVVENTSYKVIPIVTQNSRILTLNITLTDKDSIDPINGIFYVHIPGYYKYNLYYSENLITDINTINISLLESNVAIVFENDDFKEINEYDYSGSNELSNYIAHSSSINISEYYISSSNIYYNNSDYSQIYTGSYEKLNIITPNLPDDFKNYESESDEYKYESSINDKIYENINNNVHYNDSFTTINYNSNNEIGTAIVYLSSTGCLIWSIANVYWNTTNQAWNCK